MCSNLQSVQISGFCIWNVSKLPGIYLHLVPKLWRKMINRPAARQPINKPGFIEKQAGFFFAPVQVAHWLEYVGMWCVFGRKWDVCIHFVCSMVYVHSVVYVLWGKGIGFVYRVSTLYMYMCLLWYSSMAWKLPSRNQSNYDCSHETLCPWGFFLDGQRNCHKVHWAAQGAHAALFSTRI